MTDELTESLHSWASRFALEGARPEAVAAFVERVDAGIVEQIAEIAGDPVLVEDLHRSTGAQWTSFLSTFGGEHRFALPPAAADLARSLARRGLDLGVLLKVYRAAHPGVFSFVSEITDALSEDDPPSNAALKFMWTRAEQWMDDSVEQLISTFYEEREYHLAGALARRAEIVEALLSGTAPGTEDPSGDLGHALTQWQTAFVAWAPEAGRGATDPLLGIAAEAARALKAPRPLSIVAGSRDVWFWVATPAEPDLAALAGLTDQLDGARLAIGLPAPGVSGFRSSHDEARAAQRLVLPAPSAPPLVYYRDLELLCLVDTEDAALRRMVAREIGELCGAEKNLAQIRETTLTYLTSQLNVAATAERLYVHRNTVRYRLSRAEELLGHPLADRAAHVELALRYVALFGPPVDLIR